MHKRNVALFTRAVSALLVFCALATRAAEMTWEYAVQISASVTVAPPKVTLTWPQDQAAAPYSYTVYRKTPEAAGWGSGIPLPGTATSYVDTTVVPGAVYEYQVHKVTAAYNGYGYIAVGDEAPLQERRGKILLLVDATQAASLANELTRLRQDLVGDGWTVTRFDISRTESVANVKALIKNAYNADPANVKAVFLFGRIPVPYSGNLVPDGHAPDHQGAWPADAYYGDMDGVWTDSTVNNTGAEDARTRNVPGDGKFDQSILPSAVELQIGRVDFANMPGRKVWGGPATFPSETELLRRYLNKDHSFRHKQFTAPRRALLHDTFGTRGGEAFAASGYRNYAALLGADKITAVEPGLWISTLKNNSYLMAYGCGGGSYTSIVGLGNTGAYLEGTTVELVEADIKSVFVMLMGSWLGDWDSEDNIMRGVLATASQGLACSWSGRPHWFYHHLGVGQNLGYCARLTQNNGANGLYRNQVNSVAGGVHVALLGDPTLRLHPVAPPAGAGAVAAGNGVNLSWSPAPEPVLGYHVYRAANANGPYTRLTSALTTQTSFTDATSGAGLATYMVRAVKLESTPSGTYYNPSQGIFATVSGGGGVITNPPPIVVTNPPPTNVSSTVWVEDNLPAGAVGGAEGGDSWNWISANPTPYSGKLAHASAISAGMHQHYFDWAQTTLSVNTGERLYCYVYLDPANPPRELMLQWRADTWEHRAYWGENLINFGADGTAGRKYAGSLPAPGQWARLDVTALAVGLEGQTIRGMGFAAYGGRVIWDAAGKSSGAPPAPPADTTAPTVSLTAPANNAVVSGIVTVSAAASDNVGVAGVQFRVNGNNMGAEDTTAPYSVNWNTASVTSGVRQLTAVARDAAGNRRSSSVVTVTINNVTPTPTNPPPAVTNGTVWVEDSLPAGAVSGAEGGDSWNWISANPTPYSGKLAHASAISAGMHQHYFDWAQTTLSVNTGERLYCYVYLDPANPPRELMLQWRADTWEHRAYWGENLINFGADGTASRKYAGSLPAPGQWARLDVTALAVGLEGQTIRGMGFAAYGGRVVWDAAGKSSGAPPAPPADTTAPTVSLTAPTNNAVVSGIVTVSAAASDNVGVAGVQFRVNGNNMGAEDTTAPYSVNWNTASVTSGVRQLTAVARDAAGNRRSSSVVTVTINNVVTAPTNQPPSGTNDPFYSVNAIDYTTLQLPPVGEHALHILAPTLLELQLINLKQPDPAVVTSWNWVDANCQFRAPAWSEFAVIVNGQPIAVKTVGFKRRPFYAPVLTRDLRLLNSLYLELATAVPEAATVEVRNPSGALWPATTQFKAEMTPQRYSPAVHVNQEGYVPAFPKKAMVGYYLGNLGEMTIPASSFQLVDNTTGVTVYQGTLKSRPDVGFAYSPLPYQKVLEADFSSFKTTGEYRLVVPGLGSSLPFLVDDGIAMAFARTYALGLYHQRCGTNNALPFTRHVHENCHLAAADVPMPPASFPFTWTCIAGKTTDYASNPRHTAPRLTDAASQRYPFVKSGKIDVSGGHHDAGDYSKYTINSAALAHYLLFAVDAFPGVAALDNLGLPESGDSIGDILQEAKWELDYLAKLQDADGGFFFLVYPREREYEWGVTPDQGDPQVVWPKNTAASAAATAALAQAAGSPTFKARYPQVAARYLQQAKAGWAFLTNAIARFGKDGAYQKLTHYGNEFMHDDELAWAACELFLATGEAGYHQQFKAWFDPSDAATWRWGWWRLYEAYGAATRSYAFAARSGRLTASRLDPAYLAKCEEQVRLCAQDQWRWSRDTAYGTSFPLESKTYRGAGWFFSSERAFDITVGYQLDPRPEYLEAILANMNYEAGCNPVNASYITGLGWKRQREVVHQYAVADQRVLPPSGIPQGNIQGGFMYVEQYQGELNATVYPDDNATTAPYPFYDRWSDAYNVSTEFVHLDQARSLGSLAFLATLTPAKSQAWVSNPARIIVPAKVAVGSPTNATLEVPGLTLDGARIVWEAEDQEPCYDTVFTVNPRVNGPHWIEAEAQWPDGRRVFASATFDVTAPTFVWVDDALPAGATPGAEGGDAWNWISGNPAPQSGSLAHRTAAGAGFRQHFFSGASATMNVAAGDKLFVYIFLDPASLPTEIMLQWNSGGWEQRAYWGADKINLGVNGTNSRRYMGALPPAGKWVRLEVPASQVGLEGKAISGMAFSLFDGAAAWDAAGRSDQ